MTKLRKLKRYSQQDVADKLGISQTKVSQIEQDITQAKICDLIKISKILDVHIVDLIDFREIDIEDIKILKKKILEIEKGLE